MPLETGMALGERYWLVERLAVGGMGEVWEAGDATLQRRVAVKVLRPHALDDKVFHKRFRDEAVMAAALTHPHVAMTYDYGLHEDQPYLVMELVEGETLASILSREGTMAPERVASIMAQSARALAAAHAVGVVHRDIKPANIMVTADDHVKLTDFGIARSPESLLTTRTGELIGTPHYMSPEQVRGASATPASDFYALGIVAHELLTGRRPFDKKTPLLTAEAQVSEPPPPLPDEVPLLLRQVIDRCLAKDPGDRWPDGEELAATLEPPTDDLDLDVPLETVLEPQPQPPGPVRMRPSGAVAAAPVGYVPMQWFVIALACGILLAALVWRF